MQYYRCKCGDRQSWTSMGVYRCASCSKCGSDLAQHLDDHREPVPHDFTAVEMVATDEGSKPLTRCRYCHRTRAEIEARNR